MHVREQVAKLFAATHLPARLDIRLGRVGDYAAAVLLVDGSPLAIFVLDLTPAGDQMSRIYSITNPDKLSRVD